MSIQVHHLLATNRLVQKISAVFIAFFCWSQLTVLHQHTMSFNVPLCFFNQEQLALEAPETVAVTLRGKKADLARLDHSALALHIDAAQLKMGNNGIMVTNKDLFLPESVAVVHYYPLPLVITKK